MLDVGKIEQMTAKASTIREALFALKQHVRPHGVVGLLYGYIVHLRSRARNDAVIAHTGPAGWDKAFFAAGGTATDIIAQKVEHMTEPCQLCLDQVEDTMRVRKDPRVAYIAAVRGMGCNTAWIAPIHDRNFAGYGVFEFLMHDFAAPLPCPADDLTALGLAFHAEMKRSGRLAREFDLSCKEVEALRGLSCGKTAADIADAETVSDRAIEKRVHSARRKLRAANAVEAVYKATAYGVLPG